MKALCLTLATLSAAICLQAQDTYQQQVMRDRIAVDAGIYIPMGQTAANLGLSGAFGLGLHFWKAFSEEGLVVGTVSNAWMPLGTHVKTDSGVQDLSGYTLNLTQLLGGVGYAYTAGDLLPFLIAQAGVQFATLEVGGYPPSEQFNNLAYFTAGGTAGLGYRVNTWLGILGMARYLHMFGEDLHHIDITMGASFRL
jgi:hypothetical protein